MPKLLCVKCEVELHPEKNGVTVKELFRQNQQVYRIWQADLWQCLRCGLQVIAGFAEKPLAEHFQEGFPTILEAVDKSGEFYLDRELP